MARPDLHVLLASGRPVVCDGAMGTQLFARGMKPGESAERWNLDRPDDVRAIHTAYAAAGCDLITTNTFGGTGFSLARHGLEGRVAELNCAGATLAREAAGEDRWVLGDVGPFGDFLEPMGEMTPDRLGDLFRRQIAALLEGGADAILVETMVDPAEVEVAVAAALAEGARTVIATYAFTLQPDGTLKTMMGVGVDEAVRRAAAAGAQVVGSNCGTGMGLDDYLRLAGQIAGALPPGCHGIIQPNAGAPCFEDGKTHYRATPAEMASLAPRLRNAGMRVIGGCCGTSPAHLGAMAAALR